jgi:hypothetical protein
VLSTTLIWQGEWARMMPKRMVKRWLLGWGRTHWRSQVRYKMGGTRSNSRVNAMPASGGTT